MCWHTHINALCFILVPFAITQRPSLRDCAVCQQRWRRLRQRRRQRCGTSTTTEKCGLTFHSRYKRYKRWWIFKYSLLPNSFVYLYLYKCIYFKRNMYFMRHSLFHVLIEFSNLNNSTQLPWAIISVHIRNLLEVLLSSSSSLWNIDLNSIQILLVWMLRVNNFKYARSLYTCRIIYILSFEQITYEHWNIWVSMKSQPMKIYNN